MINPLDSFPEEWLVEAHVERSGGRDDRGNPRHTAPHSIGKCLYAPRSSVEPVPRSDIAQSSATLYAPVGTVIESTDIITIPQGRFSVDGIANVWPNGVEIPLRSEHG